MAPSPQSFTRFATLARRWGTLDLGVAVALLVLSQSNAMDRIGLSTTGCAGLGLLFASWGAVAILGLAGAALLLHPTGGSVLAIGLGTGSLLLVGYTVLDLPTLPSIREPLTLAAVFGGPSCAQLGIGLALLAIRRRALVAAT